MTNATAFPRPIGAAHSPMPHIRGLVNAGAALAGIFVLGFGIWSCVAPLESAALAPGVVEVESSRKTVQHLEGGIIAAILVRDGETVMPGQTLIRLEDTKARTTLAGLQGQLWDAQAAEIRLITERDGGAALVWPDPLASRRNDPALAKALSGQERIFETRRSLLQSKIDLVGQRIAETREEIDGLKSQEASARRRIDLIRDEMVGVKQLVSRGLERKPRLLGLERDLAEMEGRRGDALAQIARAQQTIAEAEVNILSLRNDNQKEVAEQLRETQQKLHELQEQVQAATDTLQRTEVRAPEAGVVTDLRVHTPGGVVNPGEPLLDLVPGEDRLVVTAQLRPEDIDLVRVGLPALVRLTPYKQRRVPPIEGKVTYVSADRLVDKHTNQPYYEARIALDAGALAKFPEVELVPGMPGDVMIRTGESTVALYALSPILDSFHRAFREK